MRPKVFEVGRTFVQTVFRFSIFSFSTSFRGHIKLGLVSAGIGLMSQCFQTLNLGLRVEVKFLRDKLFADVQYFVKLTELCISVFGHLGIGQTRSNNS